MKYKTKINLLKALLKKTTNLKKDKSARIKAMAYLNGAFNILTCREHRDGIISSNEMEIRFDCVDGVEKILESASQKILIKS